MKKQLSIRKRVSLISQPASKQFRLEGVINDLEKTVNQSNSLCRENLCSCNICLNRGGEEIIDGQSHRIKFSTNLSYVWLKKILESLSSYRKTLKLYLPDTIFIQGDSLEIYQTNRKDNKLLKASGATPLKYIYTTMVRLRKQYKQQLEQNFNRKMLDKIDKNFLHIKYFDKILPSNFHEGRDTKLLNDNKKTFQRYVLQSDNKYQISSLEEHKMNDKQPFCIVRFKDGFCQLLSQKEFQTFTSSSMNKIQAEVAYIQSFIKYKQDTESICFSQCNMEEYRNQQLFRKAETEVLIMLQGITKYDEGYNSIETFEELTIDLMINNPQKYTLLMTYKIINYIAMVSRIYVQHIKVKWIVNDMGNIYLQEVLEFQVSEIPKWHVRFLVPPKNEAKDFYQDSKYFTQVFKNCKRQKEASKKEIQNQISGKSYQQVLEYLNTNIMHEMPYSDKQKQSEQLRGSRIPEKPQSRSIQVNSIISSARKTEKQTKASSFEKGRYSNSTTYKQHLQKHPELVKKQTNHNYSVGKWKNPSLIVKREGVQKKIHSHFRYQNEYDSSNNAEELDYKKLKLENPQQKRLKSLKLKSNLRQYMQKKNKDNDTSLLFTTFFKQQELNSESMSMRLKKEVDKNSRTISY